MGCKAQATEFQVTLRGFTSHSTMFRAVFQLILPRWIQVIMFEMSSVTGMSGWQGWDVDPSHSNSADNEK